MNALRVLQIPSIIHAFFNFCRGASFDQLLVCFDQLALQWSIIPKHRLASSAQWQHIHLQVFLPSPAKRPLYPWWLLISAKFGGGTRNRSLFFGGESPQKNHPKKPLKKRLISKQMAAFKGFSERHWNQLLCLDVHCRPWQRMLWVHSFSTSSTIIQLKLKNWLLTKCWLPKRKQSSDCQGKFSRPVV